jgi:hypothetical protein
LLYYRPERRSFSATEPLSNMAIASSGSALLTSLSSRRYFD